MERNPGGANRPFAIEGIPHTLRNPKDHYHIRKSPLAVTVQRQINAVHASNTHL